MAAKCYRNIITARKWTKENKYIILALVQTNEKDDVKKFLALKYKVF